MTVEVVVLGVILIIMGLVQTWLRHGPGGRTLRAEEAAIAERRARIVAAARAAQYAEEDDDDERAEDELVGGAAAAGAPSRPRQAYADRRPALRSGKVWTAWTAVLGGVGIALGIVLVVLGALGQ